MHRLVVTVVIPAYNEEKTVGNVISETISVMDEMGMPYEVIVVDDGSTDKTGLIASNNKVTLLSNQNNRGKGYSLRKAFQQAREAQFAFGQVAAPLSPRDIRAQAKAGYEHLHHPRFGGYFYWRREPDRLRREQDG
jgi:glycosyltransferase involved in cell wall biosynthesis